MAPPVCFNCGSADDLTRDHCPPAGFFPSPRPDNLITVDCCGKCNDSFKMDDEAFRVLVTAPPDVSAAGAWIRDNRVFARSFKRSPKLAENVLKCITPAKPGESFDTLTMPTERAERFLTRLTKGLLAHYYPDFPRNGQTFYVRNFTMSSAAVLDELSRVKDLCKYDERGNGVFKFRHDVEKRAGFGLWIYCFYDSSLFAVYHKREELDRGPESAA